VYWDVHIWTPSHPLPGASITIVQTDPPLATVGEWSRTAGVSSQNLRSNLADNSVLLGSSLHLPKSKHGRRDIAAIESMHDRMHRGAAGSAWEAAGQVLDMVPDNMAADDSKRKRLVKKYKEAGYPKNSAQRTNSEKT